MKKLLTLLLLFICSFNYAQSLKLNINAVCVTYCKLMSKAFVAVREIDSNYPNSLLQLNPYNGIVEKSISLTGEPKLIELTPDNKFLYLSYQSIPQIEKVDIAEFKIVETIYTGVYIPTDFAILPTNENVLIVCNGSTVVMFKDRILQPKKVSCGYIDNVSAICIKNDGSKLYAHDGLTTGYGGHIMDIVDDGIEYNGIIWNYMMAAFNEIKIHNDLICDEFGDILDAFSDSIPKLKASMPVNKITRWRTGFDYSDIHGCYVFGHDNEDEGYISFFDGNYFNYLGSLDTGIQCEAVYDLDVVDANHFILLVLGLSDSQYSILLYSTTKSKSMIQLKPRINNSMPAASKWYDK
jgi:hypothetical protein